MLENLRTRDDELFRQLAVVCRHVTHSTRLLEEMLAGRSGDEARYARAIHDSDGEAHALAREVDIRVFKAFVTRVDRMELHAFVAALDASVDAVEKAALHAAALHGGAAPAPLRALAGHLTRAAEAVEAAVPHVWDAPAEVEARTTEVRRAVDAGRAAFDAGFGELFSGELDTVDVLRWKDLYEKIRHALDRCAEAADALHQMAAQAT